MIKNGYSRGLVIFMGLFTFPFWYNIAMREKRRRRPRWF
jgi:hypothetical protein